MHTVSVVRYKTPLESVRRALDKAGALTGLRSGDRVFVKPNIVFWSTSATFPKWGVITTSRVVADTVAVLKEAGAGDIVIGEGTVRMDPKSKDVLKQAYWTLGYEKLSRRYGVRLVDVMERPFETRDLGDGVVLKFSADALAADRVITLPVLKTHAQTVVSLGIKNLKGLIDMDSRKRCHSADPERDLHFQVSKLADPLPPVVALIDGIYSNERGPGFDGTIRRTNLLVASADVFSADCVGARLLGYGPDEVPHLVHAATARNRPTDLSDIAVTGEDVDSAARRHEYDFPYNDDETLPLPMANMGIQGIAYRKYDLSMCTYCSAYTGAILMAVAMAWKGEKWGDVEVLTGKSMTPTPGRARTILLGKCQYQANKDHPAIQEMLPVKSCPPKPAQIIDAFHKAGIPIDPKIIENVEAVPGFFMKRYQNRPEFEAEMFQMSGDDFGSGAAG